MTAKKQITVTITGPQSSGKTMLAKAFADMLVKHDVPVHVLRDVARKRELSEDQYLSEVVEGALQDLHHFPVETIVVIDDTGQTEDHA